ncbi:MAG: protein phosphatase 2C domain-containing protein [Cyanobacteriota bacterium]
MAKTICKNCGTENTVEQEFCLSCGAYINKEFILVTNSEVKGNSINPRYSIVDKNNFIVRDNFFGKSCFDSEKLLEDSLLNIYQKYDKYSFIPKVYDAFSLDSIDYILINSNKDLYGQEYRNIREAIVEITDRERIQLIRDSAYIYELLEKDSIQSSIINLNNFFVDENLDIKLKLIKNNNNDVTIKDLGEIWKKMLIPLDMAFIEYTKYKIGEIIKQVIDGKIDDIKILIKKLDSVLESDFTEIKYYSCTDIGKKRENNEDNFYSTLLSVDEKSLSKIQKSNRGFFVVCDGMGGHEKGEVASAVAVEKIKRTILPAMNFHFSFDETKKLLEEALIYQANDSIYKENLSLGYEYEKKMGTTVVVSLVIDNSVYIAHIGDSRIYLITKNSIEQVTQDHNVAMNNYNEGKGSWNDALKNTSTTWGKMLSQAIGIKDNNEIIAEINFLNIQQDSYLLMCTDGLSDLLNDNEMKEIILNNWENPKDSVTKLINKANENGGKDNITVTCIKIKNINTFLPTVDYSDIFYSSETEINEELIEITEFNENSIKGIMAEPDM